MADKIRDGFEWQIGACRALGSPLTADVLTGLLAALDRNSRTGARILDWPGDPKADALKLRIAGGLNALARSGQDAEFSAHYEAKSGDWAALLKRILSDWDDWLYPWLDSAPQTNEVARSGVLFPGVMSVARQFGPNIEFLELGASAGLNLNMDRFSYTLGSASAGNASSGVALSPEWRGADCQPSAVNVIARAGVDLNPLNVADDAIVNRMMAYVWPDQPERVQRAEAAMKLAREHPVQVDQADGADWIEQKLAQPQEAGVTRLIYHSIALQYFPASGYQRVKAAIEGAGAKATAQRPLAWLRMEFPSMDQQVELSLRSWPGDGKPELLAYCHPHGAWVEWQGA